MKLYSYTLFILCISFSSNFATESLDKVIATVNDTPISEIDYEFALKKYNILKKFLPPPKKKRSLKSEVIDFLLERAIVDSIADSESIQVSDKRINSEIEKRMSMMGIKDKKEFERSIEKQANIPYNLWVSELPFQIKKSQLMQIKISAPVPSEKEVKEWYYKNKEKVGFEFKYRIIGISPKSSSIKDETIIYEELKKIKANVIKNPSNFNSIASSQKNEYSRNGGFVDWTPAFEIFNISRVTAGALAQIQSSGELSDIFRDERNRYCIVKLEGKRFTPLEKIKGGIQNLIYKDNEENLFNNWIIQQKKVLPIRIYDEDYLKENKLNYKKNEYEIN